MRSITFLLLTIALGFPVFGNFLSEQERPFDLKTTLVQEGQPSSSGSDIAAADAARALDIFQDALSERWSYRHANNADFDGAITALRKKIATGISVNQLGIELQKIIALGIDGHSGVAGYRLPPGGCLPFLVETAGDRFVAVTADRRAFLAEGYPYLTKIDGKDVADWCTAAASLIPKGSPQYIRHRALNLLRQVDYWRSQMNLPKRTTVEVELTDRQGKAHKMVTLQTVASPPPYGVWPTGGSRLLEGNVGYLRLPTMQETPSVAEIKEWLPKFRDTSGLIVDVRDNNGGDRAALMLLYSYLASPEDPPHVFTAAAYRLHSAHKENYLAENHHMFRAGASEWTTKERESIATFARSFKPGWQLPAGQFSDWHYMALSRLNDSDIYHYNKPVVVLLNGRCFSATDIFLAGLKGLKSVLLVGTPSAGGSAYIQEIVLGSTPFRLRIGSMASFQANGKLFDGNGIHPDVLVVPVPEYYIGGTDNVLAEALKRIRKKT